MDAVGKAGGVVEAAISYTGMYQNYAWYILCVFKLGKKINYE